MIDEKSIQPVVMTTIWAGGYRTKEFGPRDALETLAAQRRRLTGVESVVVKVASSAEIRQEATHG